MVWAVAAAMAGAVALILFRALWAGGAAGAPADAPDTQVYRAQLDDIARDLARGTLTADEATRLRAEVARRLLEADRTGRDATAPAGRGPVGVAAALALALVLGGAAGAYWWLGAPGYGDLPHAARIADAADRAAARPSQAAAETAAPPADLLDPGPEFAALMDRLREVVRDRPDDQRGLDLLARNEARLGNLVAARMAQERLVTVKGGTATAEDWLFLAQTMLGAAGGTITPESEAALEQVLLRDPRSADALYLLGLSRLQIGRPDLGFRLWARFLQVAPADNPWLAEVRGNIPAVARAAGVEGYELPPLPTALAGPTAADIAAAEGMDPEARAEMVRGMVEQLNTRLATEGGTAAEWAQLINGLGVLGQHDRARAIWTEAQGRFAGRDDDMAMLLAAARRAGVAE